MEAPVTKKEVSVTKKEAEEFAIRCLTCPAVGCRAEHARELTGCLLEADLRGHPSHGLQRFPMYVRDLRIGSAVSNVEPEIVRQTVATALVDGHNLLGPVVGTFSMQLAMKKAREAGIGMVAARGSNHFGICAWYTLQAQREGLIGISMTNCSPGLVPTRAKDSFVGTNPISMAAPAKGDDSFLLDMATSAVAFGKVEMKIHKGEMLPPGWIINREGQTVTDPRGQTLSSCGMYPLGGTEESSGYKGYGLALMVEVLSAILSGSAFGPDVRGWGSSNQHVIANLGQTFICIDPAAFEPGFTDRMQQLMDSARHLEPVDPAKPVLIPGDPERESLRSCEDRGAILYHPNVLCSLDELASQLKVEPIRRKE